MSNWNGLILTTKGQALKAKVEADECMLELTKFKTGNGQISGSQTLESLTDLVSPKQIITINTLAAEGSICKVGGVITNIGLEEGYEIRELGLFATDPDDGEILYAITTDNHPDYLQPDGSATVISEEFECNISMTNAANVTATIGTAGLATIGNVQTMISNHNTDSTAHADIRDAIEHIQGHVIGEIVPVIGGTSSYVPDGCVLADGTEYTSEQFPDLWADYLNADTPLLMTCSYADYATAISTYGQCAKWAIDTANETFKVPTIKDGSMLQQALSNSELGKAYNAGLPNITGEIKHTTAGGGIYIANSIHTGALSYESSGTGVNATGTTSTGRYDITFDASLSNSIYGDSDTVQPNSVTVRYFVCVASGAINESAIDWSAYMSALQGKANTDFTNLAESAEKKLFSGAFPSETSISILSSFSTNGEIYIPPADGYIYVVGNSTSTNAYIRLTSRITTISRADYASGLGNAAFIPVKKGETVSLALNNHTISTSVFVYAEGEV